MSGLLELQSLLLLLLLLLSAVSVVLFLLKCGASDVRVESGTRDWALPKSKDALVVEGRGGAALHWRISSQLEEQQEGCRLNGVGQCRRRGWLGEVRRTARPVTCTFEDWASQCQGQGTSLSMTAVSAWVEEVGAEAAGVGGGVSVGVATALVFVETL